MVEKHKIAAPNEALLRDAPHPVQTKLSPGQLGSIYRPAKSREQVHQDDIQRQVLFRSRLPQWIVLKLTVLATGLLVVLLAYLMSVRTMWTAGGDSALMGLSGVSFSFALFIVIGFAYFFAYGYVDRILTMTGRSRVVFFVAYAGILIISLVAGVLTARLSEWQGLYTWIIPTVLVHTLLLTGLLMLMLRHAGDVDV